MEYIVVESPYELQFIKMIKSNAPQSTGYNKLWLNRIFNNGELMLHTLEVIMYSVHCTVFTSKCSIVLERKSKDDICNYSFNGIQDKVFNRIRFCF